MHFVDVSNHQAGIDLSRIDTAAVIVKATEGRGWRDSQMATYVAQARRLNKPVGFYHFVSQDNTPADEVRNFLDHTRAHRRPGDVLILDWEPTGRNPAPTDTGWARDWLEFVTDAVGDIHPIWVYMNLSTANNGRWDGIAGRYPLWLAHYPLPNRADGYQPSGARGAVDAPWQVAAWQFTDGGRLPGWNGNLDLNELYLPWWAKEDPVTIPTIRENDPPVELRNSHGELLRDSRGNPRKGCICMAITLPLVEQDMIRQGRIKRTIDVFQAGYNPGGVAASAGTHDMGGVIDVAQGMAREDRVIWAKHGWMMAPRTREWGWASGPHGHGVLHGCVHRSPAAARQIRDMMAGRNGLASNLYVGWVKPERTWQDAARATSAPTVPPSDPVKTPAKPPEGPVPNHREIHTTLTHEGKNWQLMDGSIVESKRVPQRASVTAQLTFPADATVQARFVSWDNKGRRWVRYPAATFTGGTGVLTMQLGQGGPEADLRVDVKADQACTVEGFFTALAWDV